MFCNSNNIHSVRGMFQEFVDKKSVPSADEPNIRHIMTVVNAVAQERGLSVVRGGSPLKRTNISVYSDLDIFIPNITPISKKERKVFSNAVRSKLNEADPKYVRQMEYKTNSINYICKGLYFDLVFAKKNLGTTFGPTHE